MKTLNIRLTEFRLVDFKVIIEYEQIDYTYFKNIFFDQ